MQTSPYQLVYVQKLQKGEDWKAMNILSKIWILIWSEYIRKNMDMWNKPKI